MISIKKNQWIASLSLWPGWNADHFFMKCYNYQAQRVELIRAISQHTSVILQILLIGNDSLPININIEIFEAVKINIYCYYQTL